MSPVALCELALVKLREVQELLRTLPEDKDPPDRCLSDALGHLQEAIGSLKPVEGFTPRTSPALRLVVNNTNRGSLS